MTATQKNFMERYVEHFKKAVPLVEEMPHVFPTFEEFETALFEYIRGNPELAPALKVIEEIERMAL